MLTVVTPETAKEITLSNIKESDKFTYTPLENVYGKVAAEDVKSPESLPAFNRSSVDGFAVRASDTYGCNETLPAMLLYSGKILMGENEERVLQPDCCMEIPTGGKLPENADSAVMVEYTEDMGDEFRYILRPCAPFENVIRMGDDCKKGETVIRKGTVIQPNHISILASLGICEVKTSVPPRVGIISTGDELVDFNKTPVGTQIRNINSVMLHSNLTALGCETVIYPIIKDEEKLLYDCVGRALNECDMVLISGGSSVGERDNVRKILENFGEVLFHGIAVKPGKPTMFAVCDNKPVFGLPGHPAAAFFIFQYLVKPAVLKMQGRIQNERTVKAHITENIPSNHGRAEMVAVKLNGDSAEPLHAKSGMVSFLAKADGYIFIPRDKEGIPKDGEVEVILF